MNPVALCFASYCPRLGAVKNILFSWRDNPMKKLLALALVLALALSCLSFAAAEGTAPDTYSTIDGFDITTLDYV